MGLLTETNEQYYGGQQAFVATATQTEFTWTGDTTLVATTGTTNTNFSVSVAGTVVTTYSLTSNTITMNSAPGLGVIVVIELTDNAKWNNYGGYAYVTIEDIVNNFLVAYVGDGKLIPNAKRTDVIFHAKRGLQEFSYDTLKSIKSQELTIPPSLSLIIPQDYVNYVKLSYVDSVGVKHIIYPTTLTSNPFTIPGKEADGVPTKNNFEKNNKETSKINKNWKKKN